MTNIHRLPSVTLNVEHIHASGSIIQAYRKPTNDVHTIQGMSTQKHARLMPATHVQVGLSVLPAQAA
jgi:hypothetical protein